MNRFRPNPPVHVVERAYQLAQSGDCANRTDVVRSLMAEGYTQNELTHLMGASITSDLNRKARAAYAASGNSPVARDDAAARATS